jgi:hypothetical protein
LGDKFVEERRDGGTGRAIGSSPEGYEGNVGGSGKKQIGAEGIWIADSA